MDAWIDGCGWIVGWMGEWTDKQRERWVTLNITRERPELITTLLSPEPPLSRQVCRECSQVAD